MAIIFLLAGLVVLANFVYLMIKKRRYIAIDAKVVNYKTEQSYDSETGRSSTTHAPIYEYEYNERKYIHTDRVFTSRPPAIGTTVTIYIDPDSPEKAIAGTYKLFIILGSVAIFAAIILFFAYRNIPS